MKFLDFTFVLAGGFVAVSLTGCGGNSSSTSGNGKGMGHARTTKSRSRVKGKEEDREALAPEQPDNHDNPPVAAQPPQPEVVSQSHTMTSNIKQAPKECDLLDMECQSERDKQMEAEKKAAEMRLAMSSVARKQHAESDKTAAVRANEQTSDLKNAVTQQDDKLTAQMQADNEAKKLNAVR